MSTSDTYIINSSKPPPKHAQIYFHAHKYSFSVPFHTTTDFLANTPLPVSRLINNNIDYRFLTLNGLILWSTQ